MTYSYVWLYRFTCVTWRIPDAVWVVSVGYSVLQCVVVRCSVLQCVAVCCSVLQCVAVCWIVSVGLNSCVLESIATYCLLLIHTCDMTHFTCVTWPVHMCEMTHFTCVTWPIHTCNMTHSHLWHEQLKYVTWLTCEIYILHTIHTFYLHFIRSTYISWLTYDSFVRNTFHLHFIHFIHRTGKFSWVLPENSTGTEHDKSS